MGTQSPAQLYVYIDSAHPLELPALDAEGHKGDDRGQGAPAPGRGGRAAPLPAYIEANVSSFTLALMIFKFFSRCVSPSGSVVKC